jgi:hypothetical protein
VWSSIGFDGDRFNIEKISCYSNPLKPKINHFFPPFLKLIHGKRKAKIIPNTSAIGKLRTALPLIIHV